MYQLIFSPFKSPSMLGGIYLTSASFIPRTTFHPRKLNVLFDSQNDARNTALIFQTHFYPCRSRSSFRVIAFL